MARIGKAAHGTRPGLALLLTIAVCTAPAVDGVCHAQGLFGRQPQGVRGTVDFDPPLAQPTGPLSLPQRLPANPPVANAPGSPSWIEQPPGFYRTPVDPPLGYAGAS